MLGAHAHLVTRARRSVSLVMEFYMFSAMKLGPELLLVLVHCLSEHGGPARDTGAELVPAFEA